MIRVLAKFLLALLLVGAWSPPLSAGPVRVAYMYCDWPDGNASFKDELDQAFAALGWQVTKFENKQAKELSDQLNNFDIVIGGGVSNYHNSQDFQPYADRWLTFLQRGGVVIATDASYGAINNSWIGSLDPAFRTTSALCSAHARPSPETAAVRFTAGDPLLNLSQDLMPGLATKTNWAHLDEMGPDWSVAVRCSDDKPVLAYRRVGSGLLVVTNYFRFMGTGPATTNLLQNAMALAKTSHAGLQVLNVAKMPPALGRNQVTIRVRNILDQPMDIGATLSLMGKTPLPPVHVEQALPGQAEGQLLLDYDVPVRGEQHGTLELLKDGQVLLSIPHNFTIPELVKITVRSRHQYSHYGTVIAQVTLAPELAGHLQELSVALRLVGDNAAGTPVIVEPTALQFDQPVQLAEWAPGNYRIVASLTNGRGPLGEAESLVFLHPEPTVKFNEQGVCYVRGEPFFPLGMYHVAWSASREQMLKCLHDLAAAGFNTVHTSCTNLDVYQEVLDTADKLGLHVITEGLGAASPGLRRFKSHPAVLAWNSGDEPDCANVSPVQVGVNVDAIRDVDPNHLVYTTVANPDLLHQYAPYADVFSNDPYPLTSSNSNTVAVANATARARVAVGPGRALWMVPQCFGYAKGPWNIPTPAQERSMTYQALIEGANGLIWYAYDDIQFKVLDHPELWAMLKQLTREIKALTPTLLEPACAGQRFAAGPDNCLRGVSFQQGRELTILTAHTHEQDLGLQELDVPGLSATGQAEVMFEDRSVDVVKGKIKDTFAPYAVHVYRMKQ